MDAADMYREHILDLFKHPLNFGELEHATHEHRELNPLCGDVIKIQVRMEHDKVVDIRFQGSGCAISMASTSLLTEAAKGKTKEEIRKMTSEDLLGLLKIPIGPVRLKCALLSLEVLHKAVQHA